MLMKMNFSFGSGPTNHSPCRRSLRATAKPPATDQAQKFSVIGMPTAADLPFMVINSAQVSPVGTMAAVSTIKITLFSGARVQCNTPFGTVKP